MLTACGISKPTPETNESKSQSSETQLENTDLVVEEETTSDQCEADPTVICAPSISEEDYPRMDGSTANLPMAYMLYRLATGASEEEAKNAMNFTTTNFCYYQLMGGVVDIILAYEAGPDPKSDPKYEDLLIEPIGLDALVFLCNDANPVKSLSDGELRGIYSGRITNWAELGGDYKEIIPFQRTLNSGSQTLMQDLVMRELEFMDAPTEYRPDSMSGLVESIARYNNGENSIGYSVYYYAKNMYYLPGLRFMNVEGIAPTNESIQSGEYKYTNPFYVAIRKDTPKDSYAYQIYEWLTGDDGQSMIEAAGYVSLRQGSKRLPDGYDSDEKVADNTSDNFGPFAITASSFGDYAGIAVMNDNFKNFEIYTELRFPDEMSIQMVRNNLIVAQNPDDVVPRYENGEIVSRSQPVQYMGLFDVNDGTWKVETVFNQYSFYEPEQHWYMGMDDEPEIRNGAGTCYIFDISGNIIDKIRYNSWSELLETNLPKVRPYTYKNGSEGEEWVFENGLKFNRLMIKGVLTDANGIIIAEGTGSGMGSNIEYERYACQYNWNLISIMNADINMVENYIINDKGEIVRIHTLPGFSHRFLVVAENYSVIEYESGIYILDANNNTIFESHKYLAD